MAKEEKQKKKKRTGSQTKHFIQEFYITRTNILLFLAGLIIIAIGYIIMATGDTYSFSSLTISPILLLIGYLVIIPISILYNKKK